MTRLKNAVFMTSNEMRVERERDKLSSEIFHGKSGPYCGKTVPINRERFTGRCHMAGLLKIIVLGATPCTNQTRKQA